MQRLKRFENYIHENIEYRKSVTTAESTIDEVLQLQSGVCQDLAHLLLTAARHWGIPSRYVSGYLCDEVIYEGIKIENETHAWVECYLPQGNWITLDPTNPGQIDENLIVIAVGRDYEDVSPSRGVTFAKESGDSDLYVDVKVTRLSTS